MRLHIHGAIRFAADKSVGADIFLDETSVTGIENVVMAAALAEVA